MHRNTKVATCCYCGTRAALVLGRDRHELACASCGAPLHELKMLPVDRGPAPVRPTARGPARPSAAAPQRPVRSAARKPRKSLARRMLSGAVDALEDVFDDLFD